MLDILRRFTRQLNYSAVFNRGRSYIFQEKSRETHVDVGARPKSVAGAPFLDLPQQPDGAVRAGEILRQLHGVALRPGKSETSSSIG